MTTSTTPGTTPSGLESAPAAERPGRLLALFDALPEGGSVALDGIRSPGPLLDALQSRRPGLFEWSVLEAGPPLWRIEVARRSAPAGSRRAVLEALAWDHDRLEAIEASAFGERAAGNAAAARALYGDFAAGLRRHIAFEEELLFPAFEEGTGMPPTAGPTAVMRAEHREIASLLDRIEAAIGDPASDVESLRSSFHAVLAEHNIKEEEVLYPTTDEILGEEDADRLVARIQRHGIA